MRSAATSPLISSAYVRPKRLEYVQNGVTKRWDVAECLDNVSVLVYHRGRDAFLLVRQFRPAVLSKQVRPSEDGSYDVSTSQRAFTYELCGGLIDKGAGTTLLQHAVEEVEEELGYRVPPTHFRFLFRFRETVNLLAADFVVLYVEVDDSHRVSAGGGLVEEGECIEVVELPRRDLPKFLLHTAVSGEVTIETQHALMLFARDEEYDALRKAHLRPLAALEPGAAPADFVLQPAASAATGAAGPPWFYTAATEAAAAAAAAARQMLDFPPGGAERAIGYGFLAAAAVGLVWTLAGSRTAAAR